MIIFVVVVVDCKELYNCDNIQKVEISISG